MAGKASPDQSSYFTFAKPGLGHVGSYQVSGVPFFSSSISVPAANNPPHEISFPSVTKTLTIVNEATGAGNRPIRIAFSSQSSLRAVDGTNQGRTNYLVLNNYDNGGLHGSVTLDVRVAKVYLVADIAAASTASIYASMTPIDSDDLHKNWSGSIGIG